MTEIVTPTQRVIENLSDYPEHFDWQPIDKFALTRSLAWKGHVRIGSSEFIDMAGPARPQSAKTGNQGSVVLSDNNEF